MFITNRYTEVEKRNYKYVFYLNNRDDLENKRDFVRELNILIERFSRKLDNKGLIVKTYDVDIEKVRQEILDKPWNPYRLKTISKTPGMLMIDTEFEEFNPNKNNWIYFYFVRDQRYKNSRDNSYTIEEAEELFDKLAEIITQTDCNIFKKIKEMIWKGKIRNIRDKAIGEVINYSIGISADKLYQIINKIWSETIKKQ